MLNKIPDIDLNFSGAVQTIVQDKLIEWMDGKAYGSATLKMIGSDYFKQNVLSKFPEIEKRIQEETDDEGNTFDFQYLAEICSGGLDSISKHAGGVLTLGNTIDHNYISPAIYPGNKPEKQLSLLHEFHSIITVQLCRDTDVCTW